MKKHLTLIVVTFSISFILMGALSLFSIKRLNTYFDHSRMMDHSGFVIEKIFEAEKRLRDIDRSERGYMLTRDTMYLRYLNTSIDSIRTHISSLKELTKDNYVLQNSITSLSASVASRIGAVRANINYVDTCTTNALSPFFYASRDLMVDCSRQLKKIHKEQDILKAERYKNELQYEEITASTIKWLLVIFCVVALFLFCLLIKELNSRFRFQEELQAKVVDLRRSHIELQEIAYVASHDLQEPLRKIQVFSNMLLYQKNEHCSPEKNSTLERINSSAKRMQALITDLMSLTSLTKSDEEKKLTDLNRIMLYVLPEHEEKIKELNANIEVKTLPKINAYSNQLKILFHAMLDNSLKFSRKDIQPVIAISYDVINGHELHEVNPNLGHKKFHRITISDNGIGFEKQFTSKMFQIFQRLHQPEAGYEGKGIGLAICQRVMANHEGYILANGTPGTGATFKLFFPADA